MHASYEEEGERVLQHASEEELACHCHLRPREGGAHGGCHGRSRSRARRARKLGADAESTFETLNATAARPSPEPPATAMLPPPPPSV